jgi:hypothetical protein
MCYAIMYPSSANACCVIANGDGVDRCRCGGDITVTPPCFCSKATAVVDATDDPEHAGEQ